MTAETKFTPGPWVADGPADNVIVWSGPEQRVCFLTSNGPAKANGALIAAAPDLYDELRTSRCPRPANDMPDDTTVQQCLDRDDCGCSAGAAIRKADGKSPPYPT